MLSGAGKKFKLSLEFLRPRSGDIVSRDYFNRNLDAFLDDPKMVTLRRNRLQQILVGDWLTVKGFGASMFLGVFCPTFHYPLVVAAFQQFSAGFTLGFLLGSLLFTAVHTLFVSVSDGLLVCGGFCTTSRGSKYLRNASWS